MKSSAFKILFRTQSISKLVLLFFVLISLNLSAQLNIDSLKNSLKYIKPKDKIEIYYELTAFYLNTSPDTALNYANSGLALIDVTHNKQMKNDFLCIIGLCYEKLNKHKIAIKFLEQAQEGFGAENNKLKLIYTINSIGVIYGQTSYYDKALSYFQKSLLLSSQLKDTLRICISLTNIGLIYQNMKDYKTALNNFEKTLNLSTLLNNKLNIAHSLNNISNIYRKMENYSFVLEYNLRALNICKELKEKKGIAYITADIGETYKKLKNPTMALKHFEEAYLISKNLDDKFLNSSILSNIGDIYISKKNYEKAKEYLVKAESIATAIENKETLKDIYESLSRYYSSIEDDHTALDYYKKFKDLNDSIYTKENSDKIAELQVKFDIQEKENENKILHQKTEIQQLAINKQIYLRNTFIYISIIISLLVILVFYRYWLKQRANKILTAKNEFINHQKNELEEVYKTKDKLFAVITHDLKNPFGSIVALSSFIANNYYSLEDNHRFNAVQSVKNSIAEVYDLLKKLTAWLNSKENNVILDKTNFNLSSTVHSVIKLYQTQAEQKNIGLQIIADENIYVFADERMIKTVLRNLTDNAIKFTNNGGIVEISIKKEDNKIIVAVSDTGIGIEEGDKEKIFNLETSFTTEGTQYETGGGLGLILAKEFIEKNDGSIWFESIAADPTDGKTGGSIFYFSINKGVSNEEN